MEVCWRRETGDGRPKAYRETSELPSNTVLIDKKILGGLR